MLVTKETEWTDTAGSLSNWQGSVGMDRQFLQSGKALVTLAKREYLEHLEMEECHRWQKASWDGGGHTPRHL